MVFDSMRTSKQTFVASSIAGIMTTLLMVQWHKMINNDPDSVSESVNVLFLLVSRPLYVIGFSLNIMPVILGNKSSKPISRFLAHEFWTLFTRLIFGVFLCNTILMQFFIYDSERGIWI